METDRAIITLTCYVFNNFYGLSNNRLFLPEPPEGARINIIIWIIKGVLVHFPWCQQGGLDFGMLEVRNVLQAQTEKVVVVKVLSRFQLAVFVSLIMVLLGCWW